VLVFDGDAAGLSAAERALVRFLAQDVDLRILTLPEGLDPADYLAKDDQQGFNVLIEAAPPALEFKLRVAIDRFGLDTDLGSSRVIRDVLDAVNAAPGLNGSTRESTILQSLASRTGIPERQIRDELKQIRRESTPRRLPERTPHAQPTPVAKSDDPAERELLAALLTRPDLFPVLAQQLGADDFTTPRLRAVFEHCRDVSDLEGIPAYDLLMSSTDDPGLKQVLVGLDADARQRNLSALLNDETIHDGTTPSSPGTDAASTGAIPPVFLQVIRTLVERRRSQLWQQSRGQFIRRHAGGPLDESAKEQLRRLQQQLATRHFS